MTADDLFQPSPAVDPLSYPGRIPQTSVLLLPGRRALPIEERPDRRLGQSWVDDVPADEGDRTCTSLNYLLLSENAAPMDQRFAVLAIGSNAAPTQLAHKFSRRGVSAVIPIMQAQVSGLKVVPSAHLNRNGYVPAAPAAAPAATSRNVFVTFLDDEQLTLLDTTEPNYDRVTLDMTCHAVRMANREHLPCCFVYQSRHGVLADPRVTGGYGAMPDQQVLLTNLLRELPELRRRRFKTVAALLAGLREQSLDPEAITRAMHEHLDVREAGLRVLAEDATRYGDGSGFSDLGGAGLVVVRSRTATPGESSCSVSPVVARKQRLGVHVVVEERHHGMRAVARLVIDEQLDDTTIRLDQTLRNALGVERRNTSA